MNKFFKELKKSKLVKSSVALVLALSVLLSTFAGMSIFAADSVWDGTEALSYESGTGEQNDPYIIKTGAQLYKLVRDTDTEGKYYKLANNIYLNDVDKPIWAKNQWTGAVAIEDANSPVFRGHFDGAGHKVYGLVINVTTENTEPSMDVTAALFPLVGGGATITGIGLEDSTITLKNSFASALEGADANSENAKNQPEGIVGAIIGTVVGASASKPVSLSYSYAGAGVSLYGGFTGLVGLDASAEVNSLYITNCYANASGTVNTSDKHDTLLSTDLAFSNTNRMGILGYGRVSRSANFSGCYCSTGNLSGNGAGWNGVAKNNYIVSWGWDSGASVKLDISLMKGTSASKLMPLLDWNNVYMTTSGLPVLRLFEGGNSVAPVIDVWDGTTHGGEIKGSGTAEAPYLIENPEQFAWIMTNQPAVPAGAENWPRVKLLTDIYLNDPAQINWQTGEVNPGYQLRTWTPGEVFMQLDGNGHMVYGLYVNERPASYAETGTPAGLIKLNKSNQWEKITNLGMDYVYINTSGPAGAFIGKMNGGGASAEFDGCYLGQNVTMKGYFTAAFVGYGPSKITVKNSANQAVNMYTMKATGSAQLNASGFMGAGVWGGGKVIQNSYSVTKLHANGNANDCARTNSYAVNKQFNDDVTVSEANMRGYDVLTNANKMPKLGGAFTATAGFPLPNKIYGTIYNVWDGTVASGFAYGTGTEADPYLITNGAELARAVNIFGDSIADSYFNKYFKVVKDIYLNEIDLVNWADGTTKAGYTPKTWVSATTATDGTSPHIDGGNHIIYGMYVNLPDYEQLVGLSKKAWSGMKAKNLGMDNTFIKTKGQAAFFLGHSSNKNGAYNTFENCFIGENSTMIAGAGAGGFVNGEAKSVTIDNCYSLANVSSTGIGAKVGALAPDVWGGATITIKNSFGIGALALNTGSLTTFENCYSTVQEATGLTKLKAHLMLGMDALQSETKMAGLEACGKFTATGEYPILSSFAQLPIPEQDVWNGGKVAPSEGDGSPANPWLIYTPEEFAYVLGSSGKIDYNINNYKLMNDIYLNDITKIDWLTGASNDIDYTIRQWNPTFFCGTIDGNGHTVYGLYVKQDSRYEGSYNTNKVGLITENWGAQSLTLKNLGLDYGFVKGNGAAGGFVGYAKNGNANGSIIIDRCYTGANLTVMGASAAGFVGSGGYENSSVKISNSYSLTTNLFAGAEGGHTSGMLGEIWAGTHYISTSFAVEKLYCHNNNFPTVTKSYAGVAKRDTDRVRTPEMMKGMDALDSKDKMYDLGIAFTKTTGYPELCVFAGVPEPVAPTVPDYVWDGNQEDITEGDGTPENPFLVYTAEQFAKMMANQGSNQHYKLMENIYLNEPSLVNWENGELLDRYYDLRIWTPSFFCGTIDGNGHMVFGMYVDQPYSADGAYKSCQAGLITENWYNESLTIKNLGMDYAYVNGNGASAAFVAFNKKGSTTIDRSFVGENVTVKGQSAASFVGAGEDGKILVSNCYSLTEGMLGTEYSGAILGDCWNSNKVIATSYGILQLVGKPGNAPVIATSYSTVNTNIGENVVTLANMKGQDALTNANKMNLLGGAYFATDSFPELCVFEGRTEPLPAPVPDYVWDGESKTQPQGEGTVLKPYLISNAAELAWALSGQNNGKTYRLTADIYLNDVDAIDWATGKIIKPGYIPRTWNGAAFGGNIEGDTYHIYGLYINTNATKGSWRGSGIGLIGSISEPTVIENLGLDYAYVCGPNGVGVLAGASSKSLNISNSYLGANITLKGYSVGGFVGVGQGGMTIKNCYSNIAADRLICFDTVGEVISRRGAFLGDVWGVNSIVDSYCFGPAATNNCTFTNTYATEAGYTDACTVISQENMKGSDALSKATKMPGLDASKAFYATSGYPILRVFKDGLDYSTGEGDIWSGKIARTLTGSGTEADPYLITNGAELAFAIVKGGFGGAHFKLANDIYLNDVVNRDWMNNQNNNVWLSDSTAFNGHLDGDGHIVYGIWYPDNNAGEVAALVPQFGSGSIRNIGVRYAQVRASWNAGGIVGRTANPGNEKFIDSCFADDTCNIGFTANVTGGAAGIVGYTVPDKTTEAYTTISNCYSKAHVTGARGDGDDRTNGIVGTSWVASYKIIDCYSYGASAFMAADKNTASWIICQDGEEAVVDPGEVVIDVYCDGAAPVGFENFTLIDARENMTGEAAKTYMPGLDFENVFETVVDTTPKLKIFKNYSGEETDLTGDSEVYASGKGTKNDPYTIENTAQLRYLIESPNTKNKFYKLTKDIYVNDTTKSNWMTNSPKSWYYSYGEYVFEGTLEGDGHSIFGLFHNETPYPFGEGHEWQGGGTALFPYATSAATIRNVHLRDSYISGKACVAAIVGYVVSGTGKYTNIIGCSADESVVLKGQTVGGMVGGGPGVVSLMYDYFTGTIEATAGESGRGNGLIGDIWHGNNQAAECYSIGYPNFRGGYIPALNANLYGTVGQSGTTTVPEASMYGAAAKKAMPGLTWDDIWYTANGKTPQLKVVPADASYVFVDEGEKGRVWSGKLASKFAGGTGTEEEPYLIETPEQLAYLVFLGANKTLFNHYKLTADIKINDTSYSGWQQHARQWITGSMEFGGHLDGDGHIISGLYFNSSASYVGLFPRVTAGCLIERLGIVDATLINNSDENLTQTYTAAFGAYYGGWLDEERGLTEPKISQCFADDTVYLEGHFVGGIFCGTPRRYFIDNCYFTGEIMAEDRHGTMVGNAWSTHLSGITNSYSASKERGPMAAGNSATAIETTNYYHDGAAGNASAISVGLMFMRGDFAKEHMPGLDYNNIWKTVNGGSPVLRCFKNAEEYSCKREPAKVMIEFVTGEGSACEPIQGYPGYTPITKDTLPTPTRYGYDFGGWYYFAECDLPFELELFPEYDCYIYAKWIERGFGQGFEGKIDESYDFNEGAQLFKPGVSGYNPRYVHAGLRSVKTFGEGTPGLFLLSYDNMLKVGTKYDITFWLNTSVAGASGVIEFLHANHGQVDSDIVGYEEAYKYENLKANVWVKCKTTIIANAPFLIIRTGADQQLYFDDFQVVDTGEQGELGNLIGFNPGDIDAEPFGNLGLLWTILIIAGGVVLLGGATVVTILLVKKGKAKAV